MGIYLLSLARLVLLSLVAIIIVYTVVNSESCNRPDCRDEDFVGVVHREYENAWVMDIDQEERLVHVQTIETKLNLVFQIDEDEDLRCFRMGHIVPVTFANGPVYIRKRAREILIIQATRTGF
jgi:hypothetical protein